MYEVYINGSAKFAGTLEECENFAALVQSEDPDAEVQITEVEYD